MGRYTTQSAPKEGRREINAILIRRGKEGQCEGVLIDRGEKNKIIGVDNVGGTEQKTRDYKNGGKSP